MFVTKKRYFELQFSTERRIWALEGEKKVLETRLELEKSERERLQLEFDRLQEDFKSLVALTAGKVPPKLKPEFDRDPFQEDTRLPEVFLSPGEDEWSGDAASEMMENNGETA